MEVASLQLGPPEEFPAGGRVLRESRQTRKVVACSKSSCMFALCIPLPFLQNLGFLWIFVYLVQAISPPAADVLRHAVAMLERLGATDSTGAQVTPLGAKLAKLQVQMKSYLGFHRFQ